MKVVRSSSQVSIVPSLSSSSHVFASSVSDRGNIIRRTASFLVSLYLNISQILRNSNSDLAEPELVSTNMFPAPHGFIIHWIEIFENHEKVTEVVDVENWRIDNSRVLRWVVSLIERNSPVSSTKSSIQNEARKKTPERDRNSKTSVTPSARFQSTANGRKPKPRSNNQTPRSLPLSKSSCVAIMAVAQNRVTVHKINSRAKIQSHKTRNSNKPVDQKSHTQKPGRQIFTGHRFSPNKTSAVYEKTSPRSDLRWKPTGRIFKSVGLRWIPTGKLFDSCTSKVDSEPPHGSNVDIPNIHECKQTLDVSAGTSINVQKEQSLDLSAVMMSMIQLKSLFGPLFDEYFNGENQVVLKSSAVTTTDAHETSTARTPEQNGVVERRNRTLVEAADSTSSTSTLATTATANGNFDVKSGHGPVMQSTTSQPFEFSSKETVSFVTEINALSIDTTHAEIHRL
ncbi:retrovirus-related pol polyprotein from transposon TNT 1-94 [Tanacetum coccineum]